MRTAIPLAAALACLSGGARAQIPLPGISLQGDPKRALTPEEEERQKRIDSEYKAATKKIPNQKAADPWGDVRQGPTASAAKKKQQ